MNYDLTYCPFCNFGLEVRRYTNECTNHDCLNRLTLYKGFEKDRPEIIDYDAYIFIGGMQYIFLSAMFKDGGTITTLKDQSAEVLASIEVFTEPTVDAMEAMAHRLHKLLVFS